MARGPAMAAGSIPQRFTRENPTCNAFLTLGKIEAKVREIEKFKGDGRIAAFGTAEDAKAHLTAEQREKLKISGRCAGRRAEALVRAARKTQPRRTRIRRPRQPASA